MVAKKKKDDALSDKLETAMNNMLDSVNGAGFDMELKLKVFDRALKMLAIKHKIGSLELGAGFRDGEGDDE